ncbi:hypothetical protein [Bacteroides acidifaciens]|uniref:hypothetical protein n=1 Tax=Bacteroides acidifaciens TaxID=85831 RepID=UPI00259601F3|nr:hypothetical protein [Bacteroides acidifaciens]
MADPRRAVGDPQRNLYITGHLGDGFNAYGPSVDRHGHTMPGSDRHRIDPTYYLRFIERTIYLVVG